MTVWTLFQSPWSMMDLCETPAAEAAVASPALKECPEYLSRLRPAAWALLLTTSHTDRSERAASPRLPWRSIGRKMGPSASLSTSSHRLRFLTGQVCGWEP